jgi:anthranilate synthase component II
MPSVFIVDNYDSFTYNLVESLRQLGVRKIKVKKHDRVQIADIEGFSHVIFSPGPDLPPQHPVLFRLLDAYAPTHSILGVCLGHQAIGMWSGAQLVQLEDIKHGHQLSIKIDTGHPLFTGLNEQIEVGLYHSWMIDEATIPAHVHVTARSADGHIMACHVEGTRVFGVQFHPESYMTKDGLGILERWLEVITN